jgi:hypothetical protein
LVEWLPDRAQGWGSIDRKHKGQLMRGLFSAAAIALVLFGCGIGRVDRTEAAKDLQALLPTLAAYRVTNMYITDKCEYIVYEHGAFVSDPASSDCEMDVDGPYPRAAIDSQARADLDAIYVESEGLGQRLQHAFIQYAPDGRPITGSFGFDWDMDIIYEPGWKSLPAEDSSTVTAIDADWYEVSYNGD